MTKQIARTQRLLDVNQKLTRIEEWRQAELKRRTLELEAERVDVIQALNRDDALQGLFIDSTARWLTSLSVQQLRAEVAYEAQSHAVRDQSAREKCAERLMARQRSEAARDEEKRQLNDALDALSGKRPQASDKPLT